MDDWTMFKNTVLYSEKTKLMMEWGGMDLNDEYIFSMERKMNTAMKAMRELEGGAALVFRLCVDNYHRYCYVDSGVKGRNVHIPGILHTVRPIALESVPVFVRNTREYTVIDSESFGRLVQMEVGALLVGRIRNLHGPGRVRRGQEKGCFLYGGSTVIVLLRKNAAAVDEVYIKNTQDGVETPVRYGQRIGRALLSAGPGDE